MRKFFFLCGVLFMVVFVAVTVWAACGAVGVYPGYLPNGALQACAKACPASLTCGYDGCGGICSHCGAGAWCEPDTGCCGTCDTATGTKECGDDGCGNDICGVCRNVFDCGGVPACNMDTNGDPICWRDVNVGVGTTATTSRVNVECCLHQVKYLWNNVPAPSSACDDNDEGKRIMKCESNVCVLDYIFHY